MGLQDVLAMAAATAMLATAALAQPAGKGPGQGPVISQCAADIAKFCVGKQHDGEVRACLEAKKAEVTPACRTALDTTGGGQGKGAKK